MYKSVHELSGLALDYCVARAARYPRESLDPNSLILEAKAYQFSGNWAEGGPIIVEHKISLFAPGNRVLGTGNLLVADYWRAVRRMENDDAIFSMGGTPLLAAMRCFVLYMARLEQPNIYSVDVPEELL